MVKVERHTNEVKYSPVFDTVAVCLEENSGIVSVILDDLVLVQPSAVRVLEALGEIPMIERLDNGVYHEATGD